MTNEWDEYADGWDTDPDVVSYAERAYASLLTRVDPAGLNVLDFGCGTGVLTAMIARDARAVVGLDTSRAMLGVLDAKALPNVSTLSAELGSREAAESPLLQGGFDLITASSVCGFLEDYRGTLETLRSLLVPGGAFVQWDWLQDEGGAGRGLARGTITDTLAAAGFGAVAVEHVFEMDTPQGVLAVIMGCGSNI